MIDDNIYNLDDVQRYYIIQYMNIYKDSKNIGNFIQDIKACNTTKGSIKTIINTVLLFGLASWLLMLLGLNTVFGVTFMLLCVIGYIITSANREVNKYYKNLETILKSYETLNLIESNNVGGVIVGE